MRRQSCGRARTALVAALGTSVLSLAACSGSPGPAATASPTTKTSATAAASPTTGASPSMATLPAAECLTGTWTLVRFVGASNQTYGTGQGGDVTVAFDDGAYTLTGAGAKPIAVTLAGTTADLLVDGTSKGTYTLKDSTATFRATSASGSGTVELGGRKQRLTMDQIVSVIGLKGDGEVACTSQAMTITLSEIRLELGRV